LPLQRQFTEQQKREKTLKSLFSYQNKCFSLSPNNHK